MADLSMPVSGTTPSTPKVGTTRTTTPAEALRLILAEVTPGIRPYSSDS